VKYAYKANGQLTIYFYNNNNKVPVSGALLTDKAVVQAGGSLCNTWMQRMTNDWLFTCEMVNTA